ncbi:unnamed protein product, partial [marine sediment metagenome]
PTESGEEGKEDEKKGEGSAKNRHETQSLLDKG